MRRLLSFSALAFLLISTESPARQDPTAGSIEGSVVRADSSAAIGGALVFLNRIVNPAAASPVPGMLELPPLFRVEPQPPRRSTAGPDGKFAFKDVAPGTYRIYASAPGFATTYLGQRVVNGLGRAIHVTAGLNLKDAVLRMTSAGVVTGRVLDENSQPAAGAPVQLLRRGYSVQGVAFHDVVGTGAADDRGEYRIYDVTPGQYYLVAGTAPGTPRPERNADAAPGSADRYSFVY
jgi:hypothetical protein